MPVPLPRAPRRAPPHGDPTIGMPWGGSPPGPWGGATGAGMHGISVSPDGALLACGGADVSDCQVFSIGAAATHGAPPTLTPLRTFVGHTDWLFGLDWVTERHVVTGSRDRSVALWSVDAAGGAGCGDPTPPLAVRADKRERVRDVCASRSAGRIVSLGTAGTLRLWDGALTPIAEVGLTHSRECVCVALGGLGGTLAAVGSASAVEIVDWRAARSSGPAATLAVQSVDGANGIRSLSLSGDGALAVAGTGTGRIGFYDVRGGGWLDLGPAPLSQARALAAGPGAGLRRGRRDAGVWRLDDAGSWRLEDGDAPVPTTGPAAAPVPGLAGPQAPPPPRTYLQAGPGWLCEDTVWFHHFAGRGPVRHAVYALAQAPGDPGRLLAVGGPLASGLKGCYMACWR